MTKSIEQIIRETEEGLAESQRQLRKSMLVSDIVFSVSALVFTLSVSSLFFAAAYKFVTAEAGK